MRLFQDVFKNDLPGRSPERTIAHVVDTGEATAISRPSYKMSPRELDELKRQLEKLSNLGLIRPSSFPWGASVLFVKKKDGSMRICIDYRAINRVTRQDTHPLPRIDECLERLGGARFFSKVELKSGYHEVRIRLEDIRKQPLTLDMGLTNFWFFHSVLRNTPPTFQRLMNLVLPDYVDDFVIVYLDDILIYEHKKITRGMFV